LSPCSSWEQRRSYQKWIVFTKSPLNNSVHFEVHLCDSWQQWQSHQKWIMFKRSSFNKSVLVKVNILNSSKHWIEHEKRFIFNKSKFKDRVHFEMNILLVHESIEDHVTNVSFLLRIYSIIEFTSKFICIDHDGVDNLIKGRYYYHQSIQQLSSFKMNEYSL
jgi:hypothetical protein